MNEDLKKAYQEKTEAKLKEWSAKLTELKGKTAGLGEEAKANANKNIQELQGRIDQGKEKLAQLRQQSQENWQETKTKLEGISEGVKNTINEIKSKI